MATTARHVQLMNGSTVSVYFALPTFWPMVAEAYGRVAPAGCVLDNAHARQQSRRHRAAPRPCEQQRRQTQVPACATDITVPTGRRSWHAPSLHGTPQGDSSLSGSTHTKRTWFASPRRIKMPERTSYHHINKRFRETFLCKLGKIAQARGQT